MRTNISLPTATVLALITASFKANCTAKAGVKSDGEIRNFLSSRNSTSSEGLPLNYRDYSTNVLNVKRFNNDPRVAELVAIVTKQLSEKVVRSEEATELSNLAFVTVSSLKEASEGDKVSFESVEAVNKETGEVYEYLLNTNNVKITPRVKNGHSADLSPEILALLNGASTAVAEAIPATAIQVGEAVTANTEVTAKAPKAKA